MESDRQASWNALSRPFNSAPADVSTFQIIGADDRRAGMGLGDRHHPLQARRENAVIRLHDLDVASLRRNLSQRPVIVSNLAHEFRIASDAYSGIAPGIFSRDLSRAIRALIIYQQVFEVRIRLSEHALDALAEEAGSVVERRDDAHEWLIAHRCLRS